MDKYANEHKTDGALLENAQRVPLAERMRPRTLDEVVGQSDLIGEGKILTEIVRKGKPVNLIFCMNRATSRIAKIFCRNFALRLC